MRVTLGLLFVLILFAALAPRATAQGLVLDFIVDGKQRQAVVFAPTTDMMVKRPLVFAFHGHGGNMQKASELMHLHTVWPEAIVVYPQGVKHRPSPVDPQGNNFGWEVEANQSDSVGNKDLDFFDVMLAKMKEKYLVDEDRVYVTGFSNGAIFSYLLWAERSHIIAAVAEVAGRLWESEHLTQARPFLAIAGLADTTDPAPKQLASIETARQVDQASGEGQNCATPSGAAVGAKCMFYTSTTRTPVRTVIHTGAHVYPSWAPNEIVAFFKNHKRL